MSMQGRNPVETAAFHGNWHRARFLDLFIDEKVLCYLLLFFPLFFFPNMCELFGGFLF